MFKKIYGCLLGGAIGDALGMPFTGLSRTEITQYGAVHTFEMSCTTASLFLPIGAIADSEEGDLLEAGQWTDDTQLTLALAETILEEGGLFIPEAWGHKLVRWLNEEPRGPGLSTLHAAIQLRSAGVFWDESAAPEGGGCGAATRVAPVALLFHHSPELRRAHALTQALVTHGHVDAQAAAVAVCEAIAFVLPMNPGDFETWDGVAFLNSLASEVENNSPAFSKCLRVARNLLEDNVEPEDAIRVLGTSAWSREAVPAALYLVAQNPNDFQELLLNSLNLTSDATESIACIVGAIGGAMHGVDAIPEEWRLGVEDPVRFQALAERISNRR